MNNRSAQTDTKLVKDPLASSLHFDDLGWIDVDLDQKEVERRKQSELEHKAKEERRKDYGKSKIKKKSIKKLKKGFAQ